MRADDFLRSVARAAESRRVPDASTRLATIDPAYVSSTYPVTLPQVTFDGEDTVSGKGYACLGPYVPVPGDRVLMARAGVSWVILGRIPATSSRPVFVESTDLITGISNTAAAPGTSVLSRTFVAPASGIVEITLGGMVRTSTDQRATYLSYEVYAGTDATGTLILGAAYFRGIMVGRAVNTGAPAELSADSMRPLSGLTPGSTYYARTVHWVSGGTGGSIDYRSLHIRPVL